MALVRMLYFCAACFDIHVMSTHIAGTNNAIADALSRLQFRRFKQLAPNAADLRTRSHLCLAHSVLDQLLIQYQSLGVARRIINQPWTYAHCQAPQGTLLCL